MALETTPKPEYNVRIREMPSSDRPRERLRELGAGALSNAELLAIILRTGSASQSVLSMAHSLLSRHDGLGGLARLSFSELTSERGLGDAKAAELKATFMLAARLNALQPTDRLTVRSPDDVWGLVGGEMSVLEQEQLRVVLLNTRNQVIGVREVYKGSVNTSQVRIAELFRDAVRENASGMIVVHNHPSGDPSPSADDVVLTKAACQASRLMGIDLLDHVIIGEAGHASMKKLGLGFDG